MWATRATALIEARASRCSSVRMRWSISSSSMRSPRLPVCDCDGRISVDPRVISSAIRLAMVGAGATSLPRHPIIELPGRPRPGVHRAQPSMEMRCQRTIHCFPREAPVQLVDAVRHRARRRAVQAAREGAPARRLPLARHRPPHQRPVQRARAPGPARRLPVVARPGGLPGRGRHGARRAGLDLPDLPRLGRRHLARGARGRRHGAAARRLAQRVRPDRRTGSRPSRRRSPPSCCTPSASRTPRSCKRRATPSCMAMCGDGATSEGDFHEAMNFAAVFHLPVVFFVQNNEFAISVPLSRQTAAPSLAHKAIGYGMPGERVDGNDLAALVAVLDAAVARARTGGGPTLIEAHTYRMQAHTNADDDTRYREHADVQAWVERDPLTRMRAFLTAKKWLTAARETEIAEEAEAVAADLRTVMNEEPVADPEDLFRYVYAERTPQLAEQWEQLQRRARAQTRGRTLVTLTHDAPATRRRRTVADPHDGGRDHARARRRDGGRRRRRGLRRGRRRARRRVPRDRRAARPLRRGPLLRHPARRGRHRRHRGRHGDERDDAGRRDAVRRVRLPGVRAGGVARREDGQPHEGRAPPADRHPHPVRRRHRRRRAPLRLVRGVLRAHARASP